VLSTGQQGRSAESDHRSSRPFAAKKLVARAAAVGAAGLALYVVLPSLTKVIASWPRLSSLEPVWMFGGLTSMLILAGVSAADAFVATLAYRLGSYWFPLMAGPCAYLLFRHRYGAIGEPRRGAAERTGLRG
jgi:uncharacterized membrane protein YbhN (UPF0104 family)